MEIRFFVAFSPFNLHLCGPVVVELGLENEV
jgi:hypothetical protein